MIPAPPLFFQSGGVAPAVVQFLNSYNNNANQTTYNFSVGFGAAAPDREIFVTVSHASSSGVARVIANATIGGVSAEVYVEAGEDDTQGLGTAIISVPLPSGASGTVSIQLNGGGGSMDIGVYRVTGRTGSGAFDFDNINRNTSGPPPTVLIDVPARGFVLAVSNHANASGTIAWTGVGKNYDYDNGDGSPERVSAGHAQALAAEIDRTITATSAASNDNSCMCAASFA